MDTLYLVVGLSCVFFILSFLVAWPVVGWFVVRPIQKQLRANKEDVTSDWVIFLYKPWVYAWAIFYPLGRFNNGVTHFFSKPERMKVYANRAQWWLCAWMELSKVLFLLLIFLVLLPIYYLFLH